MVRFIRRNAVSLGAHLLTLIVGFLLGAGVTVLDIIVRSP